MLGMISQNYRIYTTDRDEEERSDQKTMSTAYREWLGRIKEVADRKLIPALEQEGMIISREKFAECVTYDKPFHLAGIQNFSGLIPVSQKLSKPIFDLTESDGNWSGARWKRTDKNGKEYGIKVNIEEADKVYTGLANAVLQMIS